MILTILKYLGLCLAAVSSIWGLTHELTTKTSDKRKRLTRAGIVSIAFIITGLVLSIISDDIGRRKAAKEQFKKVSEEARRTNQIIIASQPLTSLKFEIQFESRDTSFRRKMENADREIQENNWDVQGGVPLVPYDAMEYSTSLIPMLEFLTNIDDDKLEQSEIIKYDATKSNGIVALIPLDGSPNAILSFGEIYGEVTWNNSEDTHKRSAGFFPVDHQARSGNTSPYTTKIFLANDMAKYAIRWSLDPVTLENSIDRANTGIHSGAKLPQVINLVILRISEMLPFEYNNFAITSASNLWESKNIKESKHLVENISNMTLTIQVNGFSEYEYHYALISRYPKALYDDFGEEINIGCTILEFRMD